jgi:hypothetical protein
MVRGAFRRLNAWLSPSGNAIALSVLIAHFASRTLAARHDADSLPRQGSGRRATLVIDLRAPVKASDRSGQDASYRLLQPTCDPCTRAAFDSRAWGFRRHRPTPREPTLLSESHAYARPASRCLAATRPQVDARLTTPIELRIHCSRIPLSRKPRTAPGGAPEPRRYRPRARLSCGNLYHPCRSRRMPANRNLRRQDRVHPSLVKGERVSTNQGDFHRRVPARTPLARRFVRARHRSRALASAIRLPTLLRLPMLSHVQARRSRRQRLTPPSANSLAPLVDFCNRNTPRARPWTVRIPRTTLAVAHRRSSNRGWLLRLRLPCG